MLLVLPGGDAEGCQVESASGDLWTCLVSSNKDGNSLASRVSREAVSSESYPENSKIGPDVEAPRLAIEAMYT